jgi:hypothetical protein
MRQCQNLNFAERNKMKLTLILTSMFLACSIHAQTVQSLRAQITQLKQLHTQVAQLQAQVSALQHSPIQSLAQYVSIDYNVEAGVKAPNITFHGANIHIVNGAGSTNSVNGLGNLIIGYDEAPTTLAGGERGGSHNFVMGGGNKFTTWAFNSIVAGNGNLMNGHSSAILSGSGNQITGDQFGLTTEGVILTGGGNNLYDATDSVIVDGGGNVIEYEYAVVLGGAGNGSDGNGSVTLGGVGTTLTGEYSVGPAGIPGKVP